LAQIGTGLETMHHKYHIIHRDVKPENILLDQNGWCSIIDFNMAIKADNDDLVISNPQHQFYGTIPYIAPEMLSGFDYSYKVDWWSMGVMAYEFAYGKRPFSASRGEGTSEKKKILNCIQKTSIPSLFNDSVPSDLNELIRGLLHKNPEKRFGSKEFKAHKFFHNINWDDVVSKKIELNFIPRGDKVNFKPDANVEEAFGMGKPPKEMADVTEEQQKYFEGWNWNSEDQELPPPDPVLLAKYIRKKEKSKQTKID